MTRIVAADIWMRPGKPPPNPSRDIDDLRTGPVLGVDLNDDHLACCVLDSSGNPIGEPHTIDVYHRGLMCLAP